ncbi:MAG: hypothetical protein R2824_17920 [Saprospiraceae bacterium]
MKQIYNNALSVSARNESLILLSLAPQAKGKKIIVDIIGPKKGKR